MIQRGHLDIDYVDMAWMFVIRFGFCGSGVDWVNEFWVCFVLFCSGW